MKNPDVYCFKAGDHNSESVSLSLPESMILHFFIYLWTSFIIFSNFEFKNNSISPIEMNTGLFSHELFLPP